MRVPSPKTIYPTVIVLLFFVSDMLSETVIPSASGAVVQLLLLDPSQDSPTPLSFELMAQWAIPPHPPIIMCQTGPSTPKGTNIFYT